MNGFKFVGNNIKLMFVFLFLFCATFLYSQNNGMGVIEVNAEYKYTEYRKVTKTRSRFDPGSGTWTRNGPVGNVAPHSEIEYYTVTEPVTVTDDYKLPFIVLENGYEVFRGVTPVRVKNFDPSVTYTIIWTSKDGYSKEGTFVIQNKKPFTRYIHIE